MVETQQSNSETENILIINDNSKPILLLRIWHSFNPEKLQNVDGKGTDLMPLPNNQKEFTTTVIHPNEPIEVTIKLDYKDKLLAVSVETPTVFIYSSNDLLSNKQKEMYENLHEEAKQKGGLLFILSIDNLSIEAKAEILAQMELYRNKMIGANDFVDTERLIILKEPTIVREAVQDKYNIILNTSGILYTDFDHNPKEDLQYIKSNPRGKMRFPVMIYKLSEEPELQVDFGTEINSIFLSDESNLTAIRPPYHLYYALLKIFKEEIEKSFSLLKHPYKIEVEVKKVEVVTASSEVAYRTAVRFKCFDFDATAKNNLLHVFERHKLATFQGCEHFTWLQDIPSLILEDFKRNQLAIAHSSETSLTEKANETPPALLPSSSLSEGLELIPINNKDSLLRS